MEKIAERRVVAFTCSITPADGRVTEQRDVPITNVHGGQSGLLGRVERAVERCAFGDLASAPLTLTAGEARI